MASSLTGPGKTAAICIVSVFFSFWVGAGFVQEPLLDFHNFLLINLNKGLRDGFLWGKAP